MPLVDDLSSAILLYFVFFSQFLYKLSLSLQHHHCGELACGGRDHEGGHDLSEEPQLRIEMGLISSSHSVVCDLM